MLYDYDNEILVDNLTPPKKRLPKYLSWLYSLTKPIQDIWINLFQDWKDGSSYAEYDNSATYNFGDKVRWTDNAIFEATYHDGAGNSPSFNGAPPSNILFWTKVNDNFIGAEERITYNSQIIKLEYQLNKWYHNLAATDQIYIENNTNVSNVFVMGNTGAYSSSMPTSSVHSGTYMGNSPTYPDVSYDYIVWVPAALFATLGDNTPNREKNIESFVNQYNAAGIRYKINTY